MNLSREEIELRGRETAGRILRALREDEPVARFVDAYVARHNRGGLKSSRLRYRELLTTITREAALAMATKVAAELPRYVTGRATGLLTGHEAEAADAFREKMTAGLADHLTGSPAEEEEFRRDLALYAHMTARLPRPVSARRARESASGPFVDRCALLLDPSLLDKAQQAAGRFLLELERTVEQILEEVYRPKREPPPRAPRRAKTRSKK